SCGNERIVDLYRLARPGYLYSLTIPEAKAPALSLAFSPDGRLVAVGGLDDRVRVWDIGKRKVRADLAAPEGAVKGVQAVGFSPDGATLGAVSRGGAFRLWSVETGKTLGTFRAESRPFSLAFSPDGKKAAVGGRRGAVSIWDLEGRKKLHTL